MSVFHQLGHQADNLISDPLIGKYDGVVLSPVDYDMSNTRRIIRQHCSGTFECIFDPQLYVVDSGRMRDSDWAYFPTDVDSADPSDDGWWNRLNDAISSTIENLDIGSVASPIVISKRFSPEYYWHCVRTGDSLKERLGSSRNVLQSVMVDFKTVPTMDEINTIASVVSATRTDGLLMIFDFGTPGRIAVSDSTTLELAARLIKLLRQSGLRVVMAYCGSEMVLWRQAGCEHFATGKYWNLRRFAARRWAKKENGFVPNTAPLWFEPSLLGFLSNADVKRLSARGLLPDSSLNHPASKEILAQWDSDKPTAWKAHAWKQFMSWFREYDSNPHPGHASFDDYLASIEMSWAELRSENVLLEDPTNNGNWVRQWRLAARSL